MIVVPLTDECNHSLRRVLKAGGNAAKKAPRYDGISRKKATKKQQEVR